MRWLAPIICPVIGLGLVGLLAMGCDQAEDSAPEIEVPRAAVESLEPPAEAAFIHATLEVVDAPLPTHFRGPLPVSAEELSAMTRAYAPWTYMHAGLCYGDVETRERVLAALVQASERGNLTGNTDAELDRSYFDLLTWCRWDESCRWAGELATGAQYAPQVRSLGWSIVRWCPLESVRPVIDGPSSPDGVVVDWYLHRGEGGETVPVRLATAVENLITHGPDDSWYGVAAVLGRYDDPRLERWFSEMMARGDAEHRLRFASVLSERSEKWAKRHVRGPCRDGELSQEECRPSTHPYDPYLFLEQVPFATSAKRFDRDVLVERLAACVGSTDTVDSYFRARCLSRLADLDWRRAVAVAGEIDRAAETETEVGPILALLERHPDFPLQAELRKHGLIGPTPDPRRYDIEGVDATSVLRRYGRVITIGVGIYDDVFDQAWAMHDLARLTPELSGAAFDMFVDPENQDSRRIHAFLDGRRYALPYVRTGDTDGLRAMLGVLNGMLAAKGSTRRFVPVLLDDAGATVLLGPAEGVLSARDAGVIDFYDPDGL